MDVLNQLIDFLSAKALTMQSDNLKELTERQLMQRHGYLIALGDIIKELRDLSKANMITQIK